MPCTSQDDVSFSPLFIRYIHSTSNILTATTATTTAATRRHRSRRVASRVGPSKVVLATTSLQTKCRFQVKSNDQATPGVYIQQHALELEYGWVASSSFVPCPGGGRSTPPLSPRCGKLLPSLYADVRSTDDVIASGSEGTCRSFKKDVQELQKKRMGEICCGVAATYVHNLCCTPTYAARTACEVSAGYFANALSR